ncbi:MAG TPA: Mov34/MPN/PAD-1 family protein [Candidatus Eisenbacteria bacterium]|jgi:proteasome lid subunit RPN8/RPN11|nr:Mov34/MPN/PAD-1 family protein [Candidatus Eisenbacteria bacterium]
MGKRKPDQQPRVTIEGEVLRQIRQHARSNSKTEVCGVLIGEESGNGMNITARIAGLNAAQAGTYVTFTQDTWEHIYKIKDKEYPDDRIVGWYHSHPGFGVFLSDHDTFIHKNFFSAPLQVAWVYDPHSDEEGCFGWSGERLERLEEIRVKDDKGGEEAGETGKPEPVGGIDEDDEVVEASDHSSEVGPPAWLGWVITICSHVLLMALAITATWIFFPRPIYFFIDTHRGVIQEAPPGTHLNRDGTLSIPGVTDVQLPPASGRTTPPTAAAPETPKQPAPKPDSKDPKDQNVPRK